MLIIYILLCVKSIQVFEISDYCVRISSKCHSLSLLLLSETYISTEWKDTYKREGVPN